MLFSVAMPRMRFETTSGMRGWTSLREVMLLYVATMASIFLPRPP
jgi:hypothetical protein